MQIIENGYNTSYIDSVLSALFFNKSLIYNNFITNDTHVDLYYLQEIIKNNYIEPLRNKLSISSNTINHIRNVLFCNYKWLSTTPQQFLYEHNIVDFITYIGTTFKQDINIYNVDISDNISTNSICSHIYNIYKPTTTPDILAINIKRINSVSIDIMQQVKLFPPDNYLAKIKWNIHSVICKGNGYYSIVKYYNDWYMVDSSTIPSVTQLNMSDKRLINMIKTESILILYTL